MSDADYAADCDQQEIYQLLDRVEALEESIERLSSCAKRVIAETHESRKLYGSTMSFAVVCELDKLAATLKTLPEVKL